MDYSKEAIEQNLNTWVAFNLEDNFEFRKYQKETIINIIYNILNNNYDDNDNKCQIIEAPTGSGKSLINIISAGVLAEFYNIRSYILASDLYLWQQYYDFIQNNSILKEKIGCLKGQHGNYKCRRNNEDLSCAECKMAGMSWASLYSQETAIKKGFDCAKNCRYLKERRHALKTKVTLMTYQLFFLIVDITNEDDKVPVFDRRDVIFCDECHNIPSMIQMLISPSIRLNDAEHLYNIYKYGMQTDLDLFDEFKEKLLTETLQKKYPTENTLRKEWESLFETASRYKNTSQQDFSNLCDIQEFWFQFIDTINNIKDRIMKMIKDQSIVTKEDISIYRECNHIENYINTITQFLYMIKIVGGQYLVKQINEKDKEIFSVTYHCAREDYMVFQYLLVKVPHKVLMSATVGDQESYEDGIGVKYFGYDIKSKGHMKDIAYNFLVNPNETVELGIGELVKVKDEASIYTRVPSTFDFTNSPIHFLNKYNMGFKTREQSLSRLKPIIYKLLQTQFKDQRGMIQTGSYQIAKEIIDDAPWDLKDRFLYYNGSREKIDNITIHNMSQNTILIGPTLNEGIDLPGDKCRFIIILKVPYPQIKDRLVEAKMHLFPLWYNYTTSNQIIQGIGRGNRFKDDWCITYILDSCFFNLYMATKEQYPKELQERIKIYK